jgi:ribosomal protein S18 acetylase RimI-like enzyme
VNEIIELDIKNFEKCNNIWNMKRNKELKERFYNELLNKTRMTFVYTKDEEYIGKISVVFNKNDEDYSIPGMRLYISRIIVKKDCRGKGYGKKLMNFIIEYAKREGYEELSLGVNLDNYIALKLYVELGFNKIQYIGEDSDGKYVKLIKRL